MDEVYDVAVLGTGLTESVLSGLMAIEGKKVLHVDRNEYYGGKLASISPLETLFRHFNVVEDLSRFKRGKEWNVDLISKFIMASGKMVMLLVHTDVVKYMEFKHIEGSHIVRDGKIHKVPSNEAEALSSDLMDILEKRRFQNFLVWVMDFNIDDPNTWNKVYNTTLDVRKDTIIPAFEHFGICSHTQNFIGHAMCLYPDDSYKISAPASEVIDRIQLYGKSVLRFGKSPFIYPLYGLGELPQSFSRLCAVHGGTYMLNTPIDEIVMENGQVVGIQSNGQVARCKFVICDPTYAPDKVRKVGQVVRAICLLNHPIPGLSTPTSAQIVISQDEANRKHDIYISCVSHFHSVCPEGFFLVHISTIVETVDPHTELKAGLELLGPIEQIFYSVDDLFEPMDDGRNSKLFISRSYDASTHFESTCTDVEDIYKRITGEEFDFSKVREITSKWQEAMRLNDP